MSRKSDKICEQHRVKGNAFQRAKSFYKALQSYNAALCYAESIKSENASFIFAHRAACYLDLKLYVKCLDNIELARLANYPDEMFLAAREQLATHLLEDSPKPRGEQEAKRFFRLSYPAHKKIPFLAKCIKLQKNVKQEQHMYATQGLKTGDVIAVFEPVLESINQEAIFRRCSHCLKTNCLSLIPCMRCVSSMYCSQECRLKANEVYHWKECHYLDDLLEQCSKKPELKFLPSVMRILQLAIHEFGTLNKVSDVFNASNVHKGTFFDYDLRTERNPSLERNKFKAALGHLSTLILCKDSESTRNQVIDQWFNNDLLRILWTDPKEKEDLEVVVKRISMLAQNRFYDQLTKWTVQKKTAEQIRDDFASAVALPVAYINHSCVPNVYLLPIGTKNALVVSRPIAKDELIKMSYL